MSLTNNYSLALILGPTKDYIVVSGNFRIKVLTNKKVLSLFNVNLAISSNPQTDRNCYYTLVYL